jgi:hypothetical protein
MAGVFEAIRLPAPLLVATLVLACSRFPVQELGLAGTTWTLVTMDGRSVEKSDAPTVTFPDLDSAKVTLGSCFSARTALILDSDGYGLGFVDPSVISQDPCPSATSEGRSIVETLLHTDEWRVIDQQTIELIGDNRLVFVGAT